MIGKKLPPGERKGIYHMVLLLDQKETLRGFVRISVADWDSNIKTRGLEKRVFYVNPDGDLFPSKCKAFSYEDFQLLIVNKDKILDLLRRGPADYPKEENEHGLD